MQQHRSITLRLIETSHHAPMKLYAKFRRNYTNSFDGTTRKVSTVRYTKFRQAVKQSFDEAANKVSRKQQSISRLAVC